MARKAKKATQDADALDRIAWALEKPGQGRRYDAHVVTVADGVAYATNGCALAWAKCKMPEGVYEKSGKGKSATWVDAPDARPFPVKSLMQEHARGVSGHAESVDSEELLQAVVRAKVAHSEGTPKGAYTFRRSGSKAYPIRIVADGSGVAKLSAEAEDCEYSQPIEASGTYAVAVNVYWLADALKMMGVRSGSDARVDLRPAKDGLCLSGADSGCLIMAMRDDAVAAINEARASAESVAA